MQTTTVFVAVCCCWPHDQDAKRRIEQAAANIQDWDEAKDVVTRHRVVPLVHLAVKDLACVPDGFRKWAKQGAQGVALQALHLTRECVRIDAAFKAANVQPLHFKGPVLAQLAFGSVALKYSRDLDIFVTELEIGPAVAVLERAGYRALTQDTPVTPSQLAAVSRNFKDLGFQGPGGSYIELHWRFTHYQELLNELRHNLQRQEVFVANAGPFQTFSSVQMLEYLSFHGASHHWKRLKWLSDLAAFLQSLSLEERDRIVEQASTRSTRDAVASALALCDTLFGTHYAPDMSRRAQALYRYALTSVDQPYVMPEKFWGDMALINDFLMMRHLFPSYLAAIGGLNRHLISQVDVFAWPLPAYLNWLYPIIRVPSLLLRRLRG